VHGAHALLVILLVVNAAQAVAAGAAFTQGGVRGRRGDDILARYSRGHAWLLLAASVVLSVPPVLGLTGVVSTRLAVWVTIAGEVAAFSLARRRLPRLHAEAHDSPGAASATAAAASSASSEGTSETADS
jgi:hypothetical protein